MFTVGAFVIYKYTFQVCIQSIILFVMSDDYGSTCKTLATLFYDIKNNGA